MYQDLSLKATDHRPATWRICLVVMSRPWPKIGQAWKRVFVSRQLIDSSEKIEQEAQGMLNCPPPNRKPETSEKWITSLHPLAPAASTDKFPHLSSSINHRCTTFPLCSFTRSVVLCCLKKLEFTKVILDLQRYFWKQKRKGSAFWGESLLLLSRKSC